MATSKDYKDFILEQLSGIEKITCRAMMGEYLLYSDKVLFGGIYDNRLLIKKTKSNAVFGLDDAIPYEGAKPMYLIEDVENVRSLDEIILKTLEDLKGEK